MCSHERGTAEALFRVRQGFWVSGITAVFFQVLMVSIWFILGIEYQTENDFWVLKYQFQFWYQKSQKNFGIRYHETRENISPNPSKFPKYRLVPLCLVLVTAKSRILRRGAKSANICLVTMDYFKFILVTYYKS